MSGETLAIVLSFVAIALSTYAVFVSRTPGPMGPPGPPGQDSQSTRGGIRIERE